LTAQANPLSAAMNFVNNMLQESEERGLAHVGKASHFRISAIHGEKVLVQVIGADAEKIQFVAELVKDESHRRNFNHSAQRHGRIKLHAPAHELVLHLGELAFDPADLLNGRDHGHHHLNASKG